MEPRMSLIISFIEALLPILANLEISRAEKLKYLWALFRLTLAAARDRVFPGSARKIRLLGLQFELSNYLDFYGQFSQCFFGQTYRFSADTKTPFIIDCGSNIGVSALYFKRLYPECSMICFEPSPQAFAHLKTNIERNDLKNVRLFPFALLDTEGTIELYTHPSRPVFLGASMIPDSAGVRTKKLEVKTVPLSGYISREVDLLKLDIEGAEVPVIKELEKQNKLRLIKQMHIEYHHHFVPDRDDLSEFLAILERAGLGYTIGAEYRPQSPKRQAQGIKIYVYRK